MEDAPGVRFYFFIFLILFSSIHIARWSLFPPSFHFLRSTLSISFFFLGSCGICAVLMLRFLCLDVRTNAYIHLYIYRYSPPFDRHDWVVDRCGTRTRYIIDFYTGRADGPAGNLSFYLDVRPALDNWDGVRLRAERFWSRWVGQLWNAPSPRNAEPAAAAAGGQAQTRSS